MSRLFVAANGDFCTPSALPSLSSAVSISFWYRNTTTPGSGYPNRFSIVSRAYGVSGTDVNYATYLNSTSLGFYYTTAASTYVSFDGTMTADNGVWHNGIISTDFTTANTAMYLDGTSLSITPSGTPGTPETGGDTNDTIGQNPNLVGQEFMNGRLADIAIWSVRLTAGEASALAKGARPNTVRPASLKFWAPIDGLQSPEPDLSGFRRNSTVSTPGGGPALAPGPPVMMFTPRWPQYWFPPPPAAAASLVFSQQKIIIPLLMTVPVGVTIHNP